MPNTSHYRALKGEVYQLRSLLPKSNLYGNYTPFNIRRMIAYRVLGHSALETYFENISLEILNRCHARHAQSLEANDLLLALCLRFARLGNMHDTQYLHKLKGDVGLLVNDARDWHRRLIRENHGIKESNLKSIFGSFGSPVWTLISPLSVQLDAYGTLRGEYAHRSAATVTTPNPVDERRALDDIVTDLKIADSGIYMILSRQ